MALKSKSFGDLLTFTRATGGGRFNASGQYEWLSADQPRFDFDPVSGECRGILIEEQRTNLLLRSSEFNIASWPLAAASVVGNSTTGPDGSLTAYKLVPNTVNTNHFISQSTALADGTVATFSLFAKAAEYSQVRVNLRDKAGAFKSFIVSLVDGGTVVAPPSTITVSVSGVGNGWFRVSGTLNFGSGATTPTVYICPAVNGTDTFAGDGTSGIYIWGAQLEAGAFPTSYIPTTTAQVTRAADVCSVNNLSPWYRADEGTFMAEYISGHTDGTRTPFAAGKGSPFAASITLQFTVNGSDRNRAILNLTSGTDKVFALRKSIANTLYKQGVAWGGTSAANTVNGASPSILAEQIIPAPPERVTIGSGGTGFHLNGHIRRIRYIPRRISDTELQALTTI